MKGTLHKTENGWVVRDRVMTWSRVNSWTNGNIELPLHSIDVQKLPCISSPESNEIDGIQVEFGIFSTNFSGTVDTYAKLYDETLHLIDKHLVQALVETARQFPTDEEIDKAAKNANDDFIKHYQSHIEQRYHSYGKGFIEGAKWVIEYLKNKK